VTPKQGQFKKWPERDLTTLTEEDFAKILDEQGDEVIAATSENANFTELVEGAGRWLKYRTDNDPESLPPTFMVKLYLDGQKAIAAKQVPEEPDGTQVSILDRIDALPPEHAAMLIKGEIARLDSLRADFFAALNRIQGE